MDLLKILKEIEDDLNMIPTDDVGKRPGRYMNRAKNNLALVIADGEAREAAKREHEWLTPAAPSMGKLKY